MFRRTIKNILPLTIQNPRPSAFLIYQIRFIRVLLRNQKTISSSYLFTLTIQNPRPSAFLIYQIRFIRVPLRYQNHRSTRPEIPHPQENKPIHTLV